MTTDDRRRQTTYYDNSRKLHWSAKKVKLKFSHIRYRALGPALIPVYTGSQPAGNLLSHFARLVVTFPAKERHQRPSKLLTFFKINEGLID